ncbi:MAG TPA: hypothetical protein VJS68_00060 [Thermoplasmata archaeon]|nr:hypothetical protein [Thermoplasmata archaeon]
MTEVHVQGVVRRVGNSLAVIIPAEDARRAGMTPGTPVDAQIRPAVSSPLGLLKGLAYKPFDRHKEMLWRDRI